MWRRNRLVALAFLAATLPGGCGGKEVLGPVSGTVTFQGTPVREGMVLFKNEEKGVEITAPLREDGSYEVEMARGKGLPLGTYRVAVVPPVPQITSSWPAPPPKLPAHDNIPPKYRDGRTSGLTVEVKAEGVVFPIDMKP